jgi:hypothetical protein
LESFQCDEKVTVLGDVPKADESDGEEYDGGEEGEED